MPSAIPTHKHKHINLCSNSTIMVGVLNTLLEFDWQLDIKNKLNTDDDHGASTMFARDQAKSFSAAHDETHFLL
jgi:hypothetical protein